MFRPSLPATPSATAIVTRKPGRHAGTARRPSLPTAAIALACGLLALGQAAAQTRGAATQGQQASVTRSYDLPAGPLDLLLARFITEARVPLAAAPALVAGRHSPGLRGAYGVQAGLDALLAGTGLIATRNAEGAYVLQRAPDPGGVATLAPVTVQADSLAVTEGTGSYAMAGPVTTATRLPLTLRETPQSVSVMTRQRIEDEGIERIETLLDRTPGVSVQNIGISRFGIQSRGYAIENYQLDGIVTATDVVSQNIPQSQSDLAIYDRVEVIRGATGLLTGAGDPSGTVNLVRKKPTHAFQGHASASGSSFGSGRAELDAGGPVNASGTLRGRFVAAHEQGDTHIDHYKQEKSVLYGVLEADVAPRTLLTAGLDYQRHDPRGVAGTGLPLFYDTGEQTRYSASDNAAARWASNKIEVYNAFLNLDHRFANDWNLRIAGNRLDGKRNYAAAAASWGFPDKETGEGVRLYGGIGSARQRQTGLDAQLQGPFTLLGRRHEAVFGFNWAEFENFHEPMSGAGIEGRAVNLHTWDNDTARANVSGTKLMDYDGWNKQHGIYSALRLKPRDDLAVIVGARVSNYRYRLSQIYANPALASRNRITAMRENGIVTPYAGIVYDIDETHAIYASYTSIFMPQSYRDRNGNGLDPREGDNYEIGLKSEFLEGRLNSAIALYQIRQDNLAEADPGQTVPDTQNEVAYRAIKGAKTSGLDIELSGELAPGWQAALSYNYSISKNAGGATINTVFPRHMAKLWTTYRLPGAWQRLTVGGGVSYQSRIHFSSTSATLPGVALNGQQAAYVVTNLMARYDFSPQLAATLNVNNVFDRQYLQGLDTTFYTGIYAPTRNAMLTLRYQF
ncbi:TonB-dependent siderophore receptor [plant metagenome]|uniref:TonB-dependent siderophore receptor n=1 Tax=plant metagenome TaxID=1297885 RepID=A0A484TQG2_9ZZZZ